MKSYQCKLSKNKHPHITMVLYVEISFLDNTRIWPNTP